MTSRKYQFSWELLGDVAKGRPNLGPHTRLEAYRLMQFTFRDVMERHFGSEKADQIFFEAGKLAGAEFYKHGLSDTSDFNSFIKSLQDSLREMRIGILRVEDFDVENGRFVLSVSEDLDCSGLPELGFEVCTYDEGFVAGLLESHTGSPFAVKEIECWCTGDRTCRFEAQIAK